MNEQYFFKLDYCTMPKNNLDREILRFSETINGTLIHAGHLEAFKAALKTKVAALHREHPRCKKLELSITDYSNSGDYGISCGCTSGNIYKVRVLF